MNILAEYNARKEEYDTELEKAQSKEETSKPKLQESEFFILIKILIFFFIPASNSRFRLQRDWGI